MYAPVWEDKIPLLAKTLGPLWQQHGFSRGVLGLQVPVRQIGEVLGLLKDRKLLQFNQLIDVCGVDWLGRRQTRFEVVYHVLSMHANLRVRVKASVHEGEGVPTVVPLFPCAGWWEREVFDLYGIPFEGNPDLRRILTDYGFEGYPLRKDFPLEGYVEARYDGALGQVVQVPVHLPVPLRTFHTLSPWKGAPPGAGDEGRGPSPGAASTQTPPHRL